MKRIDILILDSYEFTTTAWKVPRVLHERVILQSIHLRNMPYSYPFSMRCRTIYSLTLSSYSKERAHLFYREHNPGMFQACLGNEDQMLGSEGRP